MKKLIAGTFRIAKARKAIAALTVGLALLAGLLLPAVASAHPLGNFSVNRYSRLEIGADAVRLYYVLDIAEIPTFQEKDLVDRDGDGRLSETEKQAYLDLKLVEIRPGLQLKLDGQPLALVLRQKSVEFPAGQGGLNTTRLTAVFDTPRLPEGAAALEYRDSNFTDRLGWREIVVRNATGVTLLNSTAPTQDVSNELRTYPEDMLSSPLNVTGAQAGFKLDPSVVVNNSAATAGQAAIQSQDPIMNQINGGELTLPLILAALGGAFILGTFHALSPGHGKTIVAAYLIGSRGTARHAAFLGLTVTVTHTLGVFALGLITLFASQFILPEKLYPWLGLASGLIVLAMGLTLFRSRLRWAFAGSPARPSGKALSEPTAGHNHGLDHSHGDHSHRHDSHDHDHQHDSHDHDHAHGDHSHSLVNHDLPHSHAPGSLNHDHAHHDHDHDHSHDHAQHDHQHGHTHEHDHSPAHAPAGAGSAGVTHSHGGKEHAHLPPGADGSAVTWRRLLLFGISAGLLPCPSALVLMLGAIALGRTLFGLVLIVFFSLGLAGTLTLLGILLVYARHMVNRVKPGRIRSVFRVVPVASAIVITVIGVAISYEALLQTGLLSR